MALEDEFAEEGCFTTGSGLPTLTVATEGEEIMIPWIALRHAVRRKQGIQIHFQGWRVGIVGEKLDELWTELQQQSVRTLCRSSSAQVGGCRIRSVEVSVSGAEGHEANC